MKLQLVSTHNTACPGVSRRAAAPHPTPHLNRLTACTALKTHNDLSTFHQLDEFNNLDHVYRLSRRAATIGLLSIPAALLSPSLGVTAATAVQEAPPASTSKLYESPAGFSLRIPSEWVLAYDRSGRLTNGVLLLCGNFKTVDTVSVAKLQPSEVGLNADNLAIDADTAATVVESLVAEQRDSGKALTFKFYGSRQRTAPDGKIFWDCQYLLEICNGRGQEVTAGKKICLSATNMELETVARMSFISFTIMDGVVYVVRGGTPADRWRANSKLLVDTVQSFDVAGAAA